VSTAGEAGKAAAEAGLNHRPELVRFLSRRLRCRATAEDIAQDAYIRLLQSTEPILNVRAWLFRVGANLAINHARLGRRRAELNAEVADLLMGGLEQATPEQHAEAADQLRRVIAALPSLSERTREILILSRFEGLSAREIGRRLGISGGAVEKHLKKALVRLLEASDPGGISP
jgi:RNA polymerase sigma-70 factor (ECF subfamily)